MPTGTSEHDNRVRQIVLKLKKEGWNVRADIPGYEKPNPIGKYDHIPDISATKKGAERLIEVETKETMLTDQRQLETFRKHSAHVDRSTFKIEVL